MNALRLDEVAELYMLIKRQYPSFDASRERVLDDHKKYLRDFPFIIAQGNVDQHIMTDRFPPTIADIRGRLGDQIERQKSKEETDAYFAKVELWQRTNAPPPAGYWENVRSQLRGDSV